MQIESLNEERLEELRKLWVGTSDPNERERITAEGKVIKAYLLNPKWGSKEVGGNTYCHSCHAQLARVGHYNCLQCAGTQEVNYQARSVAGMQQALLEMAENKRLTSAQSLESIINEVFEIR